MAMPLEVAIMAEIGFGNHFMWFEGSGCWDVRERAVRLLPEVLKRSHELGQKIAPPDPDLIALVEKAHRSERSAYTLVKTWQVAAEVIAAHIHGYYDAATLTNMRESITRSYELDRQPERVIWDYDLDGALVRRH